MSECERVSDLFGEFHEHRLDKQTETFVIRHLDGCPYCNNDYQWYGVTVKSLMSLEKVNPPDYLLQQVKAKLHETPQSESIFHFMRHFFTSSPYMPLPVGVGALILIVFVGVVIYDRSPHEVFSKSSQSMAQSHSATPAPLHRPDSGDVPWYQARVQNNGPASSFASKGFFGDQQPGGGHLQQYAMSGPRMLELDRLGTRVPFAKAIDAANLTLHSSSIPVAVDSVKRMLPTLDGNVLEEKTDDGVGEITLGVAIPSSAYPRLASELINLGALVGGKDGGASPGLTQRASDGNRLVLYIRFIPSH